jgi:hypothetical protein
MEQFRQKAQKIKIKIENEVILEVFNCHKPGEKIVKPPNIYVYISI